MKESFDAPVPAKRSRRRRKTGRANPLVLQPQGSDVSPCVLPVPCTHANVQDVQLKVDISVVSHHPDASHDDIEPTSNTMQVHSAVDAPVLPGAVPDVRTELELKADLTACFSARPLRETYCSDAAFLDAIVARNHRILYIQKRLARPCHHQRVPRSRLLS